MSEISIDDLTVRQLKTIISAVKMNFESVDSEDQQSTDNPFIGKYVICRCLSAGVHAGTLVSQKGDIVVLKNSRRLYYWIANDGIALSGVAQHGIRSDGCKVDTLNPEIMLIGAIEIIPSTKLSEDSINGYK